MKVEHLTPSFKFESVIVLVLRFVHSRSYIKLSLRSYNLDSFTEVKCLPVAFQFEYSYCCFLYLVTKFLIAQRLRDLIVLHDYWLYPYFQQHLSLKSAITQ